MVATSGDVLLAADAIEAMKRELIPLASLITPNLPEAARLLGTTAAADEARGDRAGQGALALGLRGRAAQGRAWRGETAVDILCDAAGIERFVRPRIDTRHTPRHGLHAVGRNRRPAGPGRGPARGRRPAPKPSCGRPWRPGAAWALAMATARSITCSPSAALPRRRDRSGIIVAETAAVRPHFSLFGLHGGIDAGRILGTLRAANGDLG